MILADVNVLVYAYKSGTPEHERYRAWLLRVLDGPEPVGMSSLVLSGVLRVVTHPRVFDTPTTPADALGYVNWLRDHPSTVLLEPGRRHWQLFSELVRLADARGNLVPDAYHAALAMEHGCEWATSDGDYARFPGLRHLHPLRPV